MAYEQTPILNLNLYPQGKFAARCIGFVDDLARWEEANQARSRALKKQDRLAREATCKVLLANLHQTWKRDSAATVGVLRVKNHYANRRAEIGPYVTYKSVMTLLDFFLSRNLIEIVSEGRKHPDAKQGIPTQIRARQGLIEYLDQDDASPFDFRSVYPQLVLKAGKEDSKRHLTIPDTDEAQQLALGVDQIDEMLGFHWADIELPDAELKQIDVSGLNLPEALYQERTVRRIFNNGSFDEGGRFYGGWWERIPSRYRPHITIDGMPTVEMDYSAIQPRLLLAERGVELDGDPYDIGIDDRFRPLVKETFNRLLNGKRQPFPYSNPGQGIVFDEADMGMSWDELLGAIERRFQPVADLFGSGIGLKLQRQDADIAQAVMRDFNEMHIAMLPIHDSFIVRFGHDHDLLRAMRKAMLKHSGIDVPVKVTQRKPSDLSLRLSKHWQQFNSYDPSQDNPPEPELTNQFVPGYEDYQRRVGQMIKEQHRQVFG